MSENELRPLARELVDRARSAQTPSNAQRERAYQALIAGLGGATGVSAAKLAAASGKGLGPTAVGGFKWATLALGLAAAGTSAYVLNGRAERANAPPASAALSPVAPVAKVTPAMPAPSAAAAAPATPVSSASPSALPAPKPATAVKPAGGDLGQELTLLHEALAASRSGNATRALELSQKHAREFPSSRLAAEREAIEVRSLCALGRASEARRIAEHLRAQAPGSPVSAALQETCVGK